MTKLAQSTRATRAKPASATRAKPASTTRAKPTQNAPKVSAIVRAVQPTQPIGESVSSAQTAALAAVKLYVAAGKREAAARTSATEAMATFIRTLHGDFTPKDIAQLLYGHGTTKSKNADEVVYLRSVVIYNAYNKVFEKGAYEPADKKAARLAEENAKKAGEKLDENAEENAPPHEYSDAEKLANIEDLRLEYMFKLVARELFSRGYDVPKMALTVIK